MIKPFFIFAVVLMLIPLQVFSQNKSIEIALFDYYPFLLKDSTDKGYAFDITKAAMEKSGYTVTERFLPLIRAITETIQLKHDAILGLNPSHTSAIAFSKSPITSLRFMVWGRKDMDWKYDSIDRVKEVEVLTVSGFDYTSSDKAYQEYINSKPKNVRVLFGDDAVQTAFKLIEKKRGDIFSLDIDQAAAILDSLGIADKFKAVGELNNLYFGYFGVSQDHPQKAVLLDAYEKGMSELQKSGELKSIVQRYMKKYKLKHNPL
jgi:ABC-type amino acid transport substrate-binding protein